MSKQVPPRGEELTAADSPNDTARAQLLVTPEQAQLLAEHLKSLDDVLDYAAQLVPTNGQREATLVALAAIIDCLQTFHFTRPRIDLLVGLFDALQDLDNGVVVPLMRPSPVSVRPSDPTSQWIGKVCLAAAIEARIRLGESPDVAAKAISDAAPSTVTRLMGKSSGHGDTPMHDRLIALRKNLNRKLSTGPRDGMHHRARKHFEIHIERADNLPEPNRQIELEKLAEAALKLAGAKADRLAWRVR